MVVVCQTERFNTIHFNKEHFKQIFKSTAIEKQQIFVQSMTSQ